ncbi:HET-domain-containing protein [Decorospora gaudefroyi]|uniref:HET-domain-containing protein n=1 Tax=Decorospora gaudefroyi TaxID=184978 RepID=A0A6A5JY58_9PLEO|nr:HET-domain-containing protein [Decorospora gaudefroyi]
MTTDLVISRRCRHMDWCSFPETSMEFCKRCGFTLTVSSNQEMGEASTEVQFQPQLFAAFDPFSTQPLRADSYRYSSLDLAHGRQIRVLVLKFGNLDEPLRCELEHVNLQQTPVFEALSYTWADEKGDDSLCQIISAGDSGQTIAITTNCEAALRRLRRPDADRRLWVDAICIDQSNVLERNHQVKNMIAIFRGAVRVLVYLGQGSDVLSRLVEYMGDDTAGDLPAVSDFLLLFQSRWFHRVWILQEIAVARDVLVIYGDKRMSWKDLVELSKLYLRMMAAHDLPLVLPPVIHYGLEQMTLSSCRSQGKSDLLSLLKVSQDCFCKDARDKVYAILGLLSSHPTLPLPVNYSPIATAGWVYLQVTAWHVVSSKSLEFLALVNRNTTLEMPSWIPDWTMKPPGPLPTQFTWSKEVTNPQVVSIHRQPLPVTATLNYPLTCILLVTGKRCGVVSKNRWRALLDSSHNGITHSPQDPNANNGCSSSNTLRNKREIYRNEKQGFWEQVHLSWNKGKATPYIPSLHHITDVAITDLAIPPAFGGPCSDCINNATLRKDYRYNETSPRCYNEVALAEFIRIMNRYASNHTGLATEHSLGFGPEAVIDGDEVWVLEGLTAPIILRHCGNGYEVIGTCYVHAVDRSYDDCLACGRRTSRVLNYQTLEYVLPPGRDRYWDDKIKAFYFEEKATGRIEYNAPTVYLPGPREEIAIC